jgi:hypothetical protein
MKSIHFCVVVLLIVLLMSLSRENEKVLKIDDKQLSKVIFWFVVNIASGTIDIWYVCRFGYDLD